LLKNIFDIVKTVSYYYSQLYYKEYEYFSDI